MPGKLVVSPVLAETEKREEFKLRVVAFCTSSLASKDADVLQTGYCALVFILTVTAQVIEAFESSFEATIMLTVPFQHQ